MKMFGSCVQKEKKHATVTKNQQLGRIPALQFVPLTYFRPDFYLISMASSVSPALPLVSSCVAQLADDELAFFSLLFLVSSGLHFSLYDAEHRTGSGVCERIANRCPVMAKKPCVCHSSVGFGPFIGFSRLLAHSLLSSSNIHCQTRFGVCRVTSAGLHAPIKFYFLSRRLFRDSPCV